jgi:hypothetical protein
LPPKPYERNHEKNPICPVPLGPGACGWPRAAARLRETYPTIDPTPPATGGHGTPPPPAAQTGKTTPVGTPEGIPVEITIGAAGGTLQSADKRIRLDIPAGALTTDQKITVQPISNHAPGGLKQAYRLSPQGLKLAKPATLTVQYADGDLNGTFAEALGVAYQDEKGYWRATRSLKLDKTARTVAVPVLQLQDESFFAALSLYPAYKVLDPGGKTKLAVHYVLPGDDLLVPFGRDAATGDELILMDPNRLLDPKFIQKWELKGEGNLRASANAAEYEAPARIPDTNPVRVEVTVKSASGELGILIGRIYVAPEGISVQLNGGDWVVYPGGANRDGNKNFVLGNRGKDYISLLWTGSVEGNYQWTLMPDVKMIYLVGGAMYQSVYNAGQPMPSEGWLTCDDDGNETGGDIVGIFHAEPAAWFLPDPLIPELRATIRGVFRVKK